MTEPPECTPEDVDVALAWQPRDDGALSGWVSVRNRSGRACRVTSKPAVIPLTGDGSPLRVDTVVTLELRIPDHVVLEPGQEARAPVGWGGWNGPAAGHRAVVVWGAERHRTEVTVSGPLQPSATGPATNISSTWFRIED